MGLGDIEDWAEDACADLCPEDICKGPEDANKPECDACAACKNSGSGSGSGSASGSDFDLDDIPTVDMGLDDPPTANDDVRLHVRSVSDAT